MDYVPQGDFLKLLMTGDGKAVGFRFGLGMEGKWVWEMKSHIDGMFMDLFKKENLPVLPAAGSPRTGTGSSGLLDTSQFDSLAVSNVDTVTPSSAATELKRTDDAVDYMQNWSILKKMRGNEEFREDVLEAYHGESKETN